MEAFKQIQLDILRAKSPQHLADSSINWMPYAAWAAFTSVRNRLNAWLSDK